MPLRDDDDEISPSDQGYLTRADHGKQDKLESKARQKGKLFTFMRGLLRTRLAPDAAKSLKKEEGRDEDAPHTEEEFKGMQGIRNQADVQKADESVKPDTLLKREKVRRRAKKEEEEEFQKDNM